MMHCRYVRGSDGASEARDPRKGSWAAHCEDVGGHCEGYGLDIARFREGIARVMGWLLRGYE